MSLPSGVISSPLVNGSVRLMDLVDRATTKDHTLADGVGGSVDLDAAGDVAGRTEGAEGLTLHVAEAERAASVQSSDLRQWQKLTVRRALRSQDPRM